MYFKGLDGKDYKFNPSKYKKQKLKCSKLHTKAREILNNLFPFFTILEELRCFGTKKLGKTDLFADFYILEINTIYEIHGKQHYEYIPFYHKNKFSFLDQKRRDSTKLEWCVLNNLNLIILKYDEINEWETKISGN